MIALGRMLYIQTVFAAMFYQIVPLYQRGVKMSQRDRDAIPRIYGDVQIRVEEWTPLGRPCLSAYLFKAMPHCRDELPPLYEVSVAGMATLAFVIEGTELVDGCFYRQAWHCKESDHRIQVPWTLCPRSPLDELI